MKRKSKLKNKIILVFVVFTFLILSIILIFFYTSNVNYINEQSTLRVEHYLQNIDELLNRKTSELQLELESLKLFADTELQMAENVLQEKEIIEKILIKYLLDNPNKYKNISICKRNWKNYLTGIAARVFSGDITVNTTWKNESPLAGLKSFSRNNLLMFFDQNEFYILIATAKTGIIISAIPEKVFLFEQIKNGAGLSPVAGLIIMSPDSIALFSTDNKIINQKIRVPINLKSSQRIAVETGYQNITGILHNARFNFNIIINDDISNEFARLNIISLRILIFAIFILAVVMIGVIFFTNKLSSSLIEITNVSGQVASGNFTHKINIKRNDEIGILINSFNNMIVQLDSSYKSMRELNLRLEQKVRELTETRNALTQKQRLALVGETVSKISHEIQNKISGISIWIQNLELHLRDDNTAELYLDEIKAALRSFQEKLANFKKFYRQPSLNITKIDLSDFIDSFLNRYNTEIKLKQIQISVIRELYGNNYIEADKEQLEQVFDNIFINALYYSPENGSVTIKIIMSKDRIIISFTDEGPGIKEEDTNKILQPFFTTKPAGSGLGLAIVNNIIIAHKGALKYYNVPDSGACFEVSLPIKQDV